MLRLLKQIVKDLGTQDVSRFLLLTTFLFFITSMNNKRPPNFLTASAPLAVFRGADRLIDPENLKYTPEYYLLENLGAGLVYENWRALNVWQPSLASSWTRLSDHEWAFQLRKNLSWSDGSPLYPQEIVEHFERIRKGNSRHLSLIKTLDSISYNEQTHSLHFLSKTTLNDGILHELSLAEALVLHPKNLEDDWSITSGPYFVKEKAWDAITLSANPYFYPRAPIESVLIVNSLRKPGVELAKRPTYAITKGIEELVRNFDQQKVGHPTAIYYFYFNPKDPRSKDKTTRKAFAKFVKNAFTKYSYKDVLISYDQFIPSGYAGRLQSVPESSDVSLRPIQKFPLNVELNEFLTTLLPERLEEEAEKNGIDLNILFSPSDEEPSFVNFANFFGNQRDALSSWRYLYGERGPLHAFYENVQHLFEEIMTAEESRRKELLLELHKVTLEEVYAVPFLAEYDAILSSNRVDLSGLNPFDMRLRFFEMRWK